MIPRFASLVISSKGPGRDKVSDNEGTDAPRQQGARRANTRGIQPTSNAAGVSAGATESKDCFDPGPKGQNRPASMTESLCQQ